MLLDAFDTGWVSSTGPHLKRFEAEFAARVGTQHALSACNGTAALHLALLALGVKPGDEVIVPTFTYVATANAVRYCGATPVLVDCDPDTWNIEPAAILAAITPRTVGIIPVHLYGAPADMDKIMHVAETLQPLGRRGRGGGARRDRRRQGRRQHRRHRHLQLVRQQGHHHRRGRRRHHRRRRARPDDVVVPRPGHGPRAALLVPSRGLQLPHDQPRSSDRRRPAGQARPARGDPPHRRLVVPRGARRLRGAGLAGRARRHPYRVLAHVRALPCRQRTSPGCATT